MFIEYDTDGTRQIFPYLLRAKNYESSTKILYIFSSYSLQF